MNFKVSVNQAIQIKVKTSYKSYEYVRLSSMLCNFFKYAEKWSV